MQRDEARHRWTLVLLVALLQAGCASDPPRTTFTSSVLLEAVSPIKRLLVLADVRSPSFGDEMYRGFQEAIAIALASCGGELRVFHRDPMSLTEKEDLLRAVEELQPDAILRIDAAGGSMDTKDNVTKNRLRFELSLFELSADRAIWKGIAVLSVTTGAKDSNDRVAGEGFGTRIITQLRSDRVLQGCPDGPLGPPYPPEGTASRDG